jgi:hypothetical protein
MKGRGNKPSKRNLVSALTHLVMTKEASFEAVGRRTRAGNKANGANAQFYAGNPENQPNGYHDLYFSNPS